MFDYDISLILRPQENYCISDVLLQHWNAKSFSYKDSPRTEWGLLLLLCGKIEFVSSCETIIAKGGDIIFLPKGSKYEAIIRSKFGETQDYLINFEADLPFPADIPLVPHIIHHTSQPMYMDIFDRLLTLKIKDSIHGFAAKSMIYELLDHLVGDCKNELYYQKDALLKKAQKLLSDEEDLPITQIAKYCGMSDSGLRSAFKKAFGVSPLQYRMNIKINKAKFLLESTDMSVYDIADALNFYDEAYFCKMFRKHVGCSPKNYVHNKTI